MTYIISQVPQKVGTWTAEQTSLQTTAENTYDGDVARLFFPEKRAAAAGKPQLFSIHSYAVVCIFSTSSSSFLLLTIRSSTLSPQHYSIGIAGLHTVTHLHGSLVFTGALLPSPEQLLLLPDDINLSPRIVLSTLCRQQRKRLHDTVAIWSIKWYYFPYRHISAPWSRY